MPKLNRSLATSIIEDIRECVCVTNEIYSWVGKIGHLSWKFPTKTAKDINAMEIVKEHKGTAGEFYILLLELAYDRIHFLLRLIVEFMDKYPFVDDFFKEITCVKRPNQMSLASIVRLIWARLKTIPESISQQLVKNREAEGKECRGGKVSRSSQACCTVSYCESCSVAGETILEMINAIGRVCEENKLISIAESERETLKGDIYGRTQWAVMSRLSKGIQMDVKTVFATMRENNRETEATRQDYEEKIQDLRADLSRRERRVDTLQTKNAEMEGTLENVRKKLGAMERANLALEEENRTLNENLQDTRRQLLLLAGGNNILQSQVGTLAESKLELENTVNGLRRKVVETRDACLETERRFQLLLDESTKENDSIKAEHEKKIEALRQEISAMRAAAVESKKIPRKVPVSKETEPKKELQEETILIPENDPEVDMTRQLISNREKIEMLSRQNDRLSKTLNRLREYRQTAQTTTNGLNK